MNNRVENATDTGFEEFLNALLSTQTAPVVVDTENKPYLAAAFRDVYRRVPDFDKLVEAVHQICDAAKVAYPDVGIDLLSPGRQASYMARSDGAKGIFVSPEFMMYLEDHPGEGYAVLAHEVGHLVLNHDGISYLTTGKDKERLHANEYAADEFARKQGLGEALAKSFESLIEEGYPGDKESTSHPALASRIKRLRDKTDVSKKPQEPSSTV